MAWIGPAIGAVVGLLNSGDQGSQTSTKTLDPRIAPYLYGGAGGGGLLNNVNNTLAQQYGQGGLNPMQNAGLEMQRQTLMSPQYTQGFDQMRNLGAGLMGQGVAGNPFTGGGMASGMPSPSYGTNLGGSMMQAGGAGGLVNLGTPQGRMSAQGYAPNLGFSAANQPIQQQTAAPQAPMQAGDLQAFLAQLVAQQQKPKPYMPDNGYGAGGTGGGEAPGAGSGMGVGDGSVGGI